MSAAEAGWILRVDFGTVDRRFGVDAVNRLLEPGRLYADDPQLDSTGRLTATLAPDAASVAPVALRLRVREEAIEMSCACSRGRPFVCEHVVGVLVDVASHPAWREALARSGPGNPPPRELVAELPRRRAEALDDRTLDERLGRWLPARAVVDDLEIDVEVVRSAGIASAEERPALVLRHRRPKSRTLLKPREVQGARLSPRHRRLVELTAPGHTDRSVLISTRAQASMLLHLLREESPVFTRGWKSRLRFAKVPVAPRIEHVDGRLVARWVTADGTRIGDAADCLLFTGPFPYVWSEAHELFHPVSPEVDLDMAWGLQRVPSLPISSPAAAEKIGRALFSRGGGLGVALPSPETFGLPPLAASGFELTLRGSPLDVRGELYAVYPAGRARVLAAAAVRAEEDGRDLDAETRALDVVRSAGFAVDDVDDVDDGSLVAAEDRAVHFWQEGANAVRSSTAPRIDVFVSEALARVKVGPPVSVDVHVAEASGWLDTQLDFRAGSLTVELAKLRSVLAARGKWIALEGGTLARIGDEVASLVDETAALLDERGHARLRASQLGRVERWVERFGGVVDDRVSLLRERMRTLAVGTPDLPARLDATLRPYQLQGLAWLQFLRALGAGGVLADDMGLGKTVMTLALLARWRDDEGSAPSLVVCPTSVVGNWARESARFVPQLRVLVLHGADRAASRARIAASDLVVTTYAVLRRDAESLAKQHFRCVVLDEAQNVKNASARTTRVARRLDATMRLALSGTPIENRLGELWSIMTFVNPGMLGSNRDFAERFERPIANAPRGAVAEQLRAIVRPFVLRRTKADVLFDLPPKTEIDRECVLGLRQKRLYDALALTLREAVKKDLDKRGLAASRLSVLTAILRLRQMACDPRLVDASVAPAESAKRVAFLELVRDLVAEGRRALVFSQFVELFALWRQDLEREKIAYEYLDGASTDRDAIVDRFQDGTAPLFLVSLKAGGAGLNLTAADTVIHCDPWWNPAVEEQATDRAHRIGQAKAVMVVRLVAMGTIEEKILLLKAKKRELAAAVLSGDASGDALRGVTDADVALLLGELEGAGALPATAPASADEVAANAPRDFLVRRRYVAEREVDELRAILRRVESSGTPRKELARRVGLPIARVALLLIGHCVPIPTRVAEKIRALRLGAAEASARKAP